ncbi:hypothetical protein AAMO2058_000100200 [Amorphochlora amoebiformis]
MCPPSKSYLLDAFHHDDAIPPDDRHPDRIPLLLGHLLDCILEHNIHELIESTQRPGHRSVTVELDEELHIHVLGKIGARGLAHDLSILGSVALVPRRWPPRLCATKGGTTAGQSGIMRE